MKKAYPRSKPYPPLPFNRNPALPKYRAQPHTAEKSTQDYILFFFFTGKLYTLTTYRTYSAPITQ